MNAILKPSPYFIQGIPSQMVEHFWPFAEPYIKRALDHTNGEFAALDFKAGCMAQELQLWLVSREKRIVGAATTQIVCYPQQKVCRIATVAGSGFDEWKTSIVELLEAWALEQGCVALMAGVRRGFVPKLHELGFNHKYSVVVKNIKAGG